MLTLSAHPAAPLQLSRKFVGHEDPVTNAVAFFKLKLDKVMMTCLDGSSIPLEQASGKHAILEFRLYANATKNADGKITSAFVGCSLVSATELAETATSLAALPLFEGSNGAEAKFSVPAAGNGATRSPDLVPDAAGTAAAADSRPLVRDRVSPAAKAAPAAKRERRARAE